MFANIIVTDVVKTEFLSEFIDRKHVIGRYYDMYFSSGEIETLLFYFIFKEETYQLAGCTLQLDRNDKDSRHESLRPKDAFYLLDTFHLVEHMKHI